MNSRTQPLAILLSLFLVASLTGITSAVHPSVDRAATAATADPALPDFSINCSPGNLTLVRGTAGSATCTVASVNGFISGKTNVNIYAFDDFQTLFATPPPFGSLIGKPASANLTSTSHTASITVNVNSALNFAGGAAICKITGPDFGTAGACPFVYPVVVIASNETVTHTFVLETAVNDPTLPTCSPTACFPDYNASLSASSVSISAAGSASPTITLEAQNGWFGSVNLGVNNITDYRLVSNAPALAFTGGTTLANVGTYVTLPNFSTSSTATLSITTTASTPPGTYVAIIQMNGGTSQPYVQHTAILTITVT
jgi:hypothetical protein